MNRLLLPLLICLCPLTYAHADDTAELRERIQILSDELDKLKQQMDQINAHAPTTGGQTAAAPATGGETTASAVSLWGYGEINYNRPQDHASEARMDLRRAVFGFGYGFNENTRFNSEFEFEHAVTSADDQGEAEVEQFFIEHSLSDNANLKAGLFLIPMGLLNASHEPTRYYGVERNFVETAIIPTTWREGGAGLYGGTESGIAWDIGVTTGFDLGKWDPASTDGQESPLGSIHQELQNANARYLSQYLSLEYRGIPGWVAGASLFTGKAAQSGVAANVASGSRVTLWDVHTRWTRGNLDLSALYALGHISDTGDLNLSFVGNPTLVPREFWGGYLQGAYKFALAGSSSVAPFVRFERFNTGSDYADMPAGLGVDSMQTETVWTGGVNYYLNPNLVFKADYQHFSEDGDRTRYDLGMGLEF